MDPFIDLIVSFPVVIFTAMLAFSIAWWAVSAIAGGLDTDTGLEADVDADGLPDSVGDLIGDPGVPASISLTIVAFVGWVVTIALTAAADAMDVGHHAGEATIALSIGVIAVAVLVARSLSRRLGRKIAPVFTTLSAPSVSQAVGELARVRGGDVSSAGGEVIVLTGPLRTNVLRATSMFRQEQGAIVEIIANVDGGVMVETADTADPRLATLS